MMQSMKIDMTYGALSTQTSVPSNTIGFLSLLLEIQHVHCVYWDFLLGGP